MQHKQHKFYFRVEERGLPVKGNRWKFLIDKTGSIWAICWSKRSIKNAIHSLKTKHKEELDKRGFFIKEELGIK